MKIQIKHMAKAIIKWEALPKNELTQHIDNVFEDQPKLGGQLTALIVREGVPEKIVQDGVVMACIMLQAVEFAGCSLPVLDHDMFEKEQRNLGAFYHLSAAGEKGLHESVLKGHSEKVLLSYCTNKVVEYNFIGRHPQGWLLAAVLQSICNLIDQKLISL